MALTVLSIAYAFGQVGGGAVGGAEQVLSMVDEALVAAGHRSIVIGCAGSRCAGELLELPLGDRVMVDDAAWTRQHDACRAFVRDVLRREHVDVVHVHGVDFDAYTEDLGVPLLATVHLPLSFYRKRAFHREGTFLAAFVSEDQRRRAGKVPCRSVIVRNGVPLERFRFSKSKGADAASLGRMSPEKGFHLALDACRSTDTGLVLAGKVFGYREHQQYFEREIRPRLDDRRRFVGPVEGEARRDLLASARSVVVPSLTEETSSLVAMEAAASGTAVVALASGALTEIVEDGVTGCIARRVADLPGAIRRADQIAPSDCRRVAERRFDARAMCSRYIDLLESLRDEHLRSSRLRLAHTAHSSLTDATPKEAIRPLEVGPRSGRRLAVDR